MTKIDKSLREVRRWKAKVSAKTRKMKPAEVVAYFRSVTAHYRHRKKSVA